MASINKHVKVKRSAKARRMALRVDFRDRVVYLVMPKRARLDTAYDFVHEHRAWIVEQIESLPEAIPYKHGMTLPIFGKKLRLEINYDSSLKKTNISLIKNKLIVNTNKEDPSSRIERFLRELVRDKLAELSHKKAKIINKKVRSVTVRDTKSRWGSCDDKGQLSFCWRLIFAPCEAMDYIVAHEIAHLRHLDHSTKFWNLCRELSDDYVEGYHWIHNSGRELMRYGKAE